MTEATRCLNHDTNQQQCPCPSADCTRHGICCQCVAYHVGRSSRTNCMRGTQRPAATLKLPVGASPNCPSRPRNNSICPCDEAGCSRHGLCCDCIRYHWGNRSWPSPACLA
jgi:hypothetical protein